MFYVIPAVYLPSIALGPNRLGPVRRSRLSRIRSGLVRKMPDCFRLNLTNAGSCSDSKCKDDGDADRLHGNVLLDREFRFDVMRGTSIAPQCGWRCSGFASRSWLIDFNVRMACAGKHPTLQTSSWRVAQHRYCDASAFTIGVVAMGAQSTSRAHAQLRPFGLYPALAAFDQ